jgi:hypothetical protein
VLESFTIATFAGRIGHAFRIWFEPELPVDADLLSATDLGDDRGSPGGRRPFSLEFLTRVDRVYPQGTYRVQHDELSEFELFIVPIGADADGVRYEAVFT